jgi:hypothetical protein
MKPAGRSMPSVPRETNAGRLKPTLADGPRSATVSMKDEIDMFNQLNGATRLFAIIGDPVRYVESRYA